jgi:hypothetical protein
VPSSKRCNATGITEVVLNPQNWSFKMPLSLWYFEIPFFTQIGLPLKNAHVRMAQ